MIQKTVYFRTQEDLNRFNALPNKAEWLHVNLQSENPTPLQPAAVIKPRETVNPHSIPSDTKIFVPKRPDPQTGYPCCRGKAPCKHWQWSTEKTAYVNTITGETREPVL